MRYDRSPPDDSSYLDDVWDVKQRIRREEGYLCQTWDFFSSSYERNTGHIFLDDDDEIAGFSVVRSDGYILFLGVHPDHRGKGLGRALVGKVADEYNKLTCHARESNDNAVEFYRHLGFEVERHIESYYQDGESARYLVRNERTPLRRRIADAITGDE